MIPLRLLSPLWGNIAATVLLVASYAAWPRSAVGRRGRLDEAWMPDWQKRDLGLADGRSPRRAEIHRGW
ncbi:hypothetical protein [Antarcticirhabdus aurantiaca]|uniref:Uncharacterized protein n=1 Tax=Antarcticirhabdus aurantiaca TaxID=2606717 RepID=A0ACD4NLR3_9HYPH|nr:hypothetical protein [Antarcticirhabdus aurantiaca]WAJ27635.1 hypothetical protein OXU80_22775 [Jeongeuplla avenae]